MNCRMGSRAVSGIATPKTIRRKPRFSLLLTMVKAGQAPLSSCAGSGVFIIPQRRKNLGTNSACRVAISQKMGHTYCVG
jgi:hypothetical protein